MNILVTGAKGLLGNEIRDVSVKSRNKYFFTGIEELDITKKKQVEDFVKTNGIEVVINCAAFVNADKAEEEKDTTTLLNETAVRDLAELCSEVNATLVHISSDYVFRGDKSTPRCEDDLTDPCCFYGKTKVKGELSILNSGCQYLIFRTSWLYSKYGNSFVKTIFKLTEDRSDIKVVFDQVGTPTYAKDLAGLICKIIEEGLYKNNSGIYHFSNEGVCSWYDFAKEINLLAGHKCDIIPCDSSEYLTRAKRPHYSVLDKRKVKTVFGVSIPYWRESLIQCLKELDYIK